MAVSGKRLVCRSRLKRSSSTNATMRPSRSRHADVSWLKQLMPRMLCTTHPSASDNPRTSPTRRVLPLRRPVRPVSGAPGLVLHQRSAAAPAAGFPTDVRERPGRRVDRGFRGALGGADRAGQSAETLDASSSSVYRHWDTTPPGEAAMSTSEDRTSGASGMAEQQTLGLLGSELREGYAEIGDVRLHYVEAGDGPLIVLLHGFPEFWFGWRLQIKPLAAAGFRVVAPDMRGYNVSSKPDGVAAYDTGQLTADIRALIQERGAQSATLVGHDWGGSVAWATAMNHPEVVDRLAILNAAHPRKLSQGLHHPGQLRKSWYFFFFDLPELPESVVHADHWHFFRNFLRDAHPAYTPEEIDRYIEAWSQPGAATGMINYYRSSVRTPPKQAEAALRPISAPTLVIWGQRDRYLGPELAEPDHDDVPNLDRVERLPDASHWVHHDEHERVTQLLTDFFAPALPAQN